MEGTARTALLVDDSRAMRRILRGWLSELGYDRIDEAGNGVEGLERIRSEADPLPTVALVDWNMPEMDGLEMIRAVRSEPAYRDIVLVMVTSEVEGSQVVKALVAGADEYVMKPVTKDVLLGKLALLGLAPTEVAA